MNVRSDLALLGLAVVGVLADLACVLTGHQAPSIFEQVTLVGVAGAAGVALPPAVGTSSTTPAPAVPVPAPAPAAAAHATYQAAPAVAAPTVPQPAAAGADSQAPAPYSGPTGL